MFVDNFVNFSNALNSLGFAMLILLCFFTIIRMNIILKILVHLEEEFSSFFVDLNPHTSNTTFFLSGGSILFSFRYLLGDKYLLDDYLKGKKNLLVFVTVLRLLIFVILVFLLIKIKVINLGGVF